MRVGQLMVEASRVSILQIVPRYVPSETAQVVAITPLTTRVTIGGWNEGVVVAHIRGVNDWRLPGSADRSYREQVYGLQLSGVNALICEVGETRRVGKNQARPGAAHRLTESLEGVEKPGLVFAVVDFGHVDRPADVVANAVLQLKGRGNACGIVEVGVGVQIAGTLEPKRRSM